MKKKRRYPKGWKKAWRAEIEEAVESVHQVGAFIGIPVTSWPGAYFGIASALVDSGILGGNATAVFGHWTGPIHKDSYFAPRGGNGFCRHGWVLVQGGEEELVVDPTRWVFEEDDPYIFVGEPTDDDDEWPYDEGGNKLRDACMRPPPVFDVRKKKCKVNFGKATPLVRLYLPIEKDFLTWEQLHWLANLPYDQFLGMAPQVYEELKRVGHVAYIPFDNRNRAERMSE